MAMSDDATRLGQMTGPLRRAVLRAVRLAADLPDLPEAQIEVLRVLVTESTVTSSALADRLGLARPTASNLVTTMVRHGLLAREPVDGDLRRVAIRATPHARDLLRRYDRTSRTLLADALTRMDPAAREAIVVALPAFEQLTSVLTEMASPTVRDHSAS
ncbi:MarR family winged helix-turn-helix transcriptional regulator [Williamsia deligens]|uniref:MarR family winged helix-turn-helix transcriptional regulator n=1 Tax=Williamsia deligens TaxID=321325 RepID=A0ABW3GAQ1_9NOCA|nr:MarR family transcriptional regulator [Williamsia deligens]MCP2196031.1 DNA-binding transcriptional regulator, MarR family [Williamsia deligens]